MSGGVDSSVAAALLREDGLEVVGCFMRLGSDDSIEAAEPLDHAEACDPTQIRIGHQGCCSLNDAADARLVAAMLDIPFYVCNFKKDFGRIIHYFVSEYNAGRTPNPCVRCNDWLKFGKLMSYARTIDADYVATGHYARIEHRDDHCQLLRGADHHKDQSYVLFGTKRDHLPHVLLPVGSYQKSEIRQIAREKKLPVSDKPDSQEICFVPDNNYAGLIERQTPDEVKNGTIVDRNGQIVGEHGGHQHFTIGQRRGLNVSLGHPIYVIDKNPQTNTVTVGLKEQTLGRGLLADQTNWLVDPPGDQPIPCLIKIRSNSPAVPGRVRTTGQDSLSVSFDESQPAVTPGQAVVCYDGERLLGGGWICRALPT